MAKDELYQTRFYMEWGDQNRMAKVVGKIPNPEWLSDSPHPSARIEVLENGVCVETIRLNRKSRYLIGRNPYAVDIEISDVSCSRIHASINYSKEDKMILIDHNSTQGTSVDGVTIDANEEHVLTDGSRLQFASCARSYVVLLGSDPSAGKRKPDDAPIESKKKREESGPLEVRASHILVKHEYSRRPRSWRGYAVTRTKDEALGIISDYRQRIVSKTDELVDLARQYSDCSSARNGGDLGVFGRGAMAKKFEDAAFALSVGEVSEIVDGDSGYHVIKRTG